MFKKLAMLISLALFLTGCGENSEEQPGEILYHYTGELISLVDQRKEPVNKDGITFTLQLDHFYPIEDVFKKANSTYPEDHEGFRHIDFTERTKVYIQEGNTKTLISTSELSNFTKPLKLPHPSDTSYQKLEVWITPYKKDDWVIEAVEVVILQE